jgi:HK97 family phage major capsid protein
MSETTEIKNTMAKYGKELDAILNSHKENSESIMDVKAKIEEQTKTITELTNNLDARLLTLAKGQIGDLAGKHVISPEAKSVIEFICKGSIDELSKKAATVADVQSGGYVAPSEFVANIVQKLRDSGAIRSISEVINVTGSIVQIPFETDDSTTHWVGETESRDNSDSGGLGLANITTNEIVGTIKISNRLLMSAMTDIEGYFVNKLIDKLNRSTENAFAVGTGNKQPEGLFASSKVATVNSGAATNVTSNGLLDMIAAVPTDALDRGRFVMSNKTMIGFAKLKDSNGQYLLQPGMSAALPPTLWGYPVTMSSLAPVHTTASNKCAVFGDVASAYKIVQASAMSMTRDNVTSIQNGITNIWFDSFVGAQVVMPSSIVYMKVSA